MKKLLAILLFASSLFSQDIKVAVSANVSYVIEELIKEFNKTDSTKIVTILGSSGKLATKIKNSAPYHLFISADMNYPQMLYKEGFAITKPVVYANGSLVLFSTKNLDFSKGVRVILDKKIKRVSIGNPKTVPYGKASLEVIKNLKIEKEVEPKLIYAESISQVSSYVFSAVDVGFIAKSFLYSKKFKNYKEGTNWIDINDSLYTPIYQGVVITKFGENSSSAKSFYEFILSNKAKEIFKKYGYKIDE